MAEIGITPLQVTIANGASLSGAVAIGDHVPVGIAMPAAWTAASLTFQVSADGGTTWLDLYDTAGTEVAYTVAADRYIPLDPSIWIGINMIKVRSGTAAAAVNQGGARTLTLVSRR